MNYSSIELNLPRECVNDCGVGGGSKDSAVAFWLRQPDVAKQFENLTLEDSARILYGYGAWEAKELKDLETNKQRILWLASGDVADNPDDDFLESKAETFEVMLEGHGYDAELAELK
jgi:hypothetical protein